MQIESPPGTWENPLRLRFVVDASLAPTDGSAITVFRDGVRVEECPGATKALPPDSQVPDGRPCVSGRTALASGDIELTVLTPHASRWAVAAITDRTAPAIEITSPGAEQQYILRQVVMAGYSCVDPGPNSAGLASCAGPVPSGALLDTASVGPKTFAVTAVDQVGNQMIIQRTYRVIYDLRAATGPLAAPDAVHVAKAGKDVGVPFSLRGDQGAGVLEMGSPSSVQVPCPLVGTRIVLKQDASGKASAPRYFPKTDTYEYEWVTPATWAGTCRQLAIALRDGTVHTATFQFT